MQYLAPYDKFLEGL